MKRSEIIYKILKMSSAPYGEEKAKLEGAVESIYPSQIFQMKYPDLFSENIYEIYKMPTGYSDKYNANDQLRRAESFEGSKFNSFDDESLKVVFDELVSKNKSLKRFSVYLGDTYKMYTVFAGACSRFLADDIEFFIENVSESLETTESHSNMLNANKKLKLGFIPSPETLRKIVLSLRKKPGLIESIIG